MQPHEGHRMRMRQRALMGGLQSLAPHEIIELILFYAVPRRDVNGVAHALIDKFGSVGGVLSACKSELMAVHGVGEHAAELIMALNDCVSAYSKLTPASRRRLTTRRRMLEDMHNAYYDVQSTRLTLTLVNNGGEIVYSASIPANSGSIYTSICEYTLDRALKFNAAYVVIVIKSDTDDISITNAERERLRDMASMLAAVEIGVLDYIVITKTQAYSLRNMLKPDTALAEVSEDVLVFETWLNEPGSIKEVFDSNDP